jgi:hypothetical protein
MEQGSLNMTDFNFAPLQQRLIALCRSMAEEDHHFIDAKEMLMALLCDARQPAPMDAAEFEYQCEALSVQVPPISECAPDSVGYAYRRLLSMGLPWHCRYPYFDLNGMCGDRHDDAPAGPDYVGVRLSRFTQAVMPEGRAPRLPLTLLNGATRPDGVHFPAHQVEELWMALEQVRQDPGVALSDLMEILPGPDVAAGCVIGTPRAILSLYTEGSATLLLRGNVSTLLEGGRTRLEITSLPPGVSVKTLLTQIRSLGERGCVRLYDIRDASVRERVRIVLDAPPQTSAAQITALLFKETDLERSVSCALSERGEGLIATLNHCVVACSSAWERKDGGTMERTPLLREILNRGGYKSPLSEIVDERRSQIRNL